MTLRQAQGDRKVAQLYDRYLIPVYNRLGICAFRGRGSWLWDAQGRKILDLFPGWGVSALGHCHPAVVRAVREQVGLLIHVPNTIYHEPQARLAEALVAASFPSKAFFTNSGAEAVEAAIKLARSFGRPRRWEIITFQRSFHGRTFAAMSASGQENVQKGFGPLLPGFRHVPFNRIEAVEQAIGPETVAVMAELVQGEGGVHVASPEYVRALRKLCDERGLLLILDEISTGMGRTGSLFCFQSYRVIPDILLLAKPAAGGLPLGVMLAGRSTCDLWEKSSHATTFGGNPLVAAAGLAALKSLQRGKLARKAKQQGKYLMEKLIGLKKRHPMITQVRGLGLMIGVELARPGGPVVQAALRKGLLINCTQEKVLRLYPALTITRRELDRGVEILAEALEEAYR